MLSLCRMIFAAVVDLFRPRAALEAEILVLPQQIVVLRRGKPGRVRFSVLDRMVLGWVCHLFPKSRDALAIVRPDTVVRWHRAGFRCYWRWKSRLRPGRPAVPAEIRHLIRQMSIANPLWGASHSWRITQARHRHWPDQRRQAHGAKEGAAVPKLEDVPAQSCRRYRRDGLVCRSDRVLSVAVWAADHGPRPATNPVVRRHGAAHRGMDRQPTDGSLWLGANLS